MPVAVFCMFFTSREINTKRSPNAAKHFVDFSWARRHLVGQESTWGVLRGKHNPPERAWGPKRASVGCAHLGCPWTASLLYKYPNILETLGESTKINSSRRRVQKHQIQSRHHLGGVHHVHWCLFDDA